MTLEARPVDCISDFDPAAIPYKSLIEGQRPVVLKGLCRDWPLAARGRQGVAETAAYLKRFATAHPTASFSGPAEIGGRFHYNADLTAFNFDAQRQPLAEFLDTVIAHLADRTPPALYVGSTDLDRFLPGLRDENGLTLDDAIFTGAPPLVSIWLGNRTTAAAHYDMSNNLACNLVGRRRFTLFPPDQVANLYPGPLEPTPAGQVVTMVDFHHPNLDHYPRFREAMAAAQIAELEPGDVLFYPALWWHQVDALDAFNVMINYWWNPSPPFIDTPQNALLHAILSLRDRPESEKRAWHSLFDYYVFGPAEQARAHLPEHSRGILAPLDEQKARRLRAQLLNRLNR